MASTASLPSGRVTFVVTDIEGSTRLLASQPERYPDLLARHRVLLDDAWAGSGGTVVDREGDGMLVAFQDAAAALSACVTAQLALRDEAWGVESSVRVRMGAHTGSARPIDGRYVALSVHQATRVAAAAHGGQVLATSETMGAAGHDDTFEVVPLGAFRVRDFDHPVELFQVAAPGLPSEFPAVAALPARGHNLVPPSTSFVGRGDDVADLASLVRPGSLVTVVGPGGVGKSRLATEVVLALADRWTDGCWRVDVDDLARSALVLPAVGAALGVRLVTDDAAGELAAALETRHALLVLDGCEAHLDEVARVVGLVRERCPDMGLLVTSREPVHVPGEQVHRLEPLGVLGPTGSAADAPAVRLLLERARTADAAFEVDAGDEPAVEDLVRLLDGLPLALEIAAGFLTAYTPADLASGLATTPDLLRSRDRGLRARQRSVDALLGWGLDRLSPTEARLFRRLSVLGGSFPVEAAIAVAGEQTTRGEVLLALWSLVDRSLVVADRAEGGSGYRILNLVRAFAHSRLERSGELGSALDDAADWLLDAVGPARAQGTGRHGRLSAALDTLRGVVAQVGPDAGTALQRRAQSLGVAIAMYHQGAGTAGLGAAETAAVADRLRAPTPARVSLLTWVAMLCSLAGRTDDAERWLGEAESLHDLVGAPAWDDQQLVQARCDIAAMRDDMATVVRLAEEGLADATGPLGRYRMQVSAAIGHALSGRPDLALEPVRSAVREAAEYGDEVLLAGGLTNLAEVELRLGRVVAAADAELRALRLFEAVGGPAGMADSLDTAARIIAAVPEPAAGDRSTAVALFSREQALMEELGQEKYPHEAELTRTILDTAREVLGAEAFRSAWERGAAMTLGDAVTTAMAALERVGAGVRA